MPPAGRSERVTRRTRVTVDLLITNQLVYPLLQLKLTRLPPIGDGFPIRNLVNAHSA